MKVIFAVIAMSLSLSLAQAATPAKKPVDVCKVNAANATRKALQAFGWSKSIERVSLELTDEKVNDDGLSLKTYSTGMFTPVATEGYMKDTGITVEMVVTDTGCEMNQISFSTGAEFQAALARELTKMQKEWSKK